MSRQTGKTAALCRELVRKPSLTPDDAGCQQLLAERLRPLGFEIEAMNFGEVQNLWAVRPGPGPLFCFAGHTDVVPPGNLENWACDPYAGDISDGILSGRGSADMKGGLAAMVTATTAFLAEHPSPPGGIAFLITSDEEGPATDGTIKVMQELDRRRIKLDYCLIGEPSSNNRVGDTIRTGRRGSLTGRLTIIGEQGHVAYPDLARNPVHLFALALAELTTSQWDRGDADFPATSLQVVAIESGSGAGNVIPGELSLQFNFRYSPATSERQLIDRCREMLDRHQLDYRLEWEHGGKPFHTKGGKLIAAVCAVIEAQTGQRPELNTGGGTSDGRFIAPYGTEVVELGLVNKTIHKINECTTVADLDRLGMLYQGILEKMLL